MARYAKRNLQIGGKGLQSAIARIGITAAEQLIIISRGVAVSSGDQPSSRNGLAA